MKPIDHTGEDDAMIRRLLPNIAPFAAAGGVVGAITAELSSAVPDWVGPVGAVLAVLATAALILERGGSLWKSMWEAKKAQADAAKIMAQTVRDEITGLADEVRRLRGEGAERDIQMSAMRGKIVELESRAMSDAAQIEGLRRTVDNLTADNKRLTNENRLMRNRLTELDVEVDRLFAAKGAIDSRTP